MVTRYFYTICMTESCASLPWSSVIKKAIQKLPYSSSQDKWCLCALHFSKLHAHLPLAQKPFFSHSLWFLCLWSYTSQIHNTSGPIPWRLTQHYFCNWHCSKTSQAEIPRALQNLEVTTIFTTFCLVTFRKGTRLRLSKSCRLNSKPTAEGSSYPGIWVYATFTHVLYRKSDRELFQSSIPAHAKIFNY